MGEMQKRTHRRRCVCFFGFRWCGFTWRSARRTPFGDSIFLLVKKDRGERHAKGLQSRPLESCFYTGVWRGDVRTSYEFAVMQLTRFRPVRGVLRTVSTDSCVLRHVRQKRWHLKNNQPNLWSEVGWLRKFCNHYGQCSTQSAWKQCAPQGHFLRRC